MLITELIVIRMKNIEIFGVVIFKRLFFGNQREEKKSISGILMNELIYDETDCNERIHKLFIDPVVTEMMLNY